MIACFDIGGSFIKYGVPDGSGLVPELGRASTPTDDFEAFVTAMQAALARMPVSSDALVSISLCGFCDPDSGRVTVANVPCVNGRSLARELSVRLGRHVRVTNDADCFALAEAGQGVARGHENVFAIILGSGVGGGLVINGRLVSGFAGVTGEWGHGPIVDPGAGGLVEPMPRVACGCGRTDCLDPVGSARGLELLHRVLNGEDLPSAEIVSRWENKDAAAVKTVAVFVENLARVLGIVVNVTGVSIVPVGGGLGSSQSLVSSLDRRVRALVLAPRQEPLVVPGERFADGGLVGAALAGGDAGVIAA